AGRVLQDRGVQRAEQAAQRVIEWRLPVNSPVRSVRCCYRWSMAKRQSAKPDSDASADRAPTEATQRLTMPADIFGHAAAKRTLQAAMSGGRLHHAWIFHGPAGVGKFTTAYALGAAILDPTTGPGLMGGDELAPEAGSSVQTLARAGNHPDLHIINKE